MGLLCFDFEMREHFVLFILKGNFDGLIFQGISLVLFRIAEDK